MDRSWINTPRIIDAYEKEVEEFLHFGQHNAVSNDNGVTIRCPCVNCLNERILSISEIREHILCDGYLKNCTTWIWHGELLDLPSVSGALEFVNFSMDDRLENMIRDVGVESFGNAVLEIMSNDVETPLYYGSTNFIRLSTVLKLMNLKAMNGWIDKSFTELLQLLKDMLLGGSTLPNRNYEAIFFLFDGYGT